jgi:hypothetical protein
MSVGFGFSVGDFLATLKLVGTIIDALREASHSTSAFRELLNELYALETALIHVKRIELEDSQRFEAIALHQAASQCQRSIDAFWTKIQKVQPHLSQAGTGSAFKDGWAKVKWAVCKKGDVDAFRTEIRGHTSSIQVLIDAIQLNAITRHARDQKAQYRSLAATIQDFSQQAMGQLRTIADSVSQTAQQSTSLVQTCAAIFQTNFRVFQMIYDIQLFITRIPGQVQRQQPVYFIDAFNRESPFHLEFVRSAEALLAVLKVNFEQAGCDSDMIDKREFVIEESGTHNVVDITQNWDTCFYPGQRVAMSMVFRGMSDKSWTLGSKPSCPRCGSSSNGSMAEEISWCV